MIDPADTKISPRDIIIGRGIFPPKGADPVLGRPGVKTVTTGAGVITTGVTTTGARTGGVTTTTTGAGGTGTEQVGTEIVSVSVVTVPAKARDRPLQLVFAPTVTPALLITVPRNVVFAARVVAAAGVQKISQVAAPFEVTTAPAVEVSAPVDLKM